jgi:hypothetical protein
MNLSAPLPARLDLKALLVAAAARFAALSPAEQRDHLAAQRRSWVVGEMMIEHPAMSVDEAGRLYDGLAL